MLEPELLEGASAPEVEGMSSREASRSMDWPLKGGCVSGMEATQRLKRSSGSSKKRIEGIPQPIMEEGQEAMLEE
ncbi:hypothetical protein ABFY27_13625 [Akkermansia massiliensis]